MATLNDVADFVIAKTSEAGVGLNLLKLQKLVYYCQAWSLAFGRGVLFDGKFQAWVHGPVSRELYDRFAATKYLYSDVFTTDMKADFDSTRLSEEERQLIDAVLEVYAKFGGDQLEEMTHQELPWIQARGGLQPHERCEAEIDEAAMQSHYAARLNPAS